VLRTNLGRKREQDGTGVRSDPRRRISGMVSRVVQVARVTAVIRLAPAVAPAVSQLLGGLLKGAGIRVLDERDGGALVQVVVVAGPDDVELVRGVSCNGPTVAVSVNDALSEAQLVEAGADDALCLWAAWPPSTRHPKLRRRARSVPAPR
jgi:hypothetical protein